MKLALYSAMAVMAFVGVIAWGFVGIAKYGSCEANTIVWSSDRGFDDCAFELK
jgi:hypothetical protein